MGRDVERGAEIQKGDLETDGPQGNRASWRCLSRFELRPAHDAGLGPGRGTPAWGWGVCAPVGGPRVAVGVESCLRMSRPTEHTRSGVPGEGQLATHHPGSGPRQDPGASSREGATLLSTPPGL